ncbi:response regulator transcription factor [Candidatus Omnitrophota bacterium]
MDNKLIALLDDEINLLKVLELNLSTEGYRVKAFSDAGSLFEFLKKEKPDLIIIDLMLPGMNGFEVCKALKQKERLSSIPLIVLSAKKAEADKIKSLDLGYEDYLEKPCSFKELNARIRALLRRCGKGDANRIIKISDTLIMDLEKHEVTVRGKKVELTPAEFKILECLSSRKGMVFSRSTLIEYLWGEEKTAVGRTIDVHIWHLREKLGKAGESIKNVRGVGYKIEDA